MPSTTSFHHQLPSATPQNSTYWKIIYRVMFCLWYFLSSFLILFAPLHVFWKLFWHVRHIVEYLFQLMSRYAGIIINYSRRSRLAPPLREGLCFHPLHWVGLVINGLEFTPLTGFHWCKQWEPILQTSRFRTATSFGDVHLSQWRKGPWLLMAFKYTIVRGYI